MNRRVVVTGMGGISPLGNDWERAVSPRRLSGLPDGRAARHTWAVAQSRTRR